MLFLQGNLSVFNEMDLTELHDEENLYVQLEDRWENFGSLDGIVDTEDPFTLQGAPRFELTEKINALLSNALTEDEDILLRQVIGLGCKQRSIETLAAQHALTPEALQQQLVEIVGKLRNHDDAILLWKYLNR